MPLHYGEAPRWLFTRMVNLGKCIIEVLIDEYGQKEILARLADPYWFQALSCVLGYDWHSSGTTTVTCAALKTALQPKEHKLAVAGGTGRFSQRAPEEIEMIGKVFSWSEEEVGRLKFASRMSAKVDNTAIQAGYPLYHHAFFVDGDGRWLVIQQGMNTDDRTARRYHWLSDHVKSYVVEPHDAIVGSVVKNQVLDMTSQYSEGSRKTSVDLVNEGPKRVKRSIEAIRPKYQETLKKWMAEGVKGEDYTLDLLDMPCRIDWEALKKAYELRPKNYQELLRVKGIGPSTVKGLALVSDIIYGERPSWKDPVRYSFAYGGKDGVPFPVDRKAMDSSVQFLREALERAKVDDREKLLALNRLKQLVVSSPL
ncbi:MAG: DUF763 domain-containing protein [Candidatus Bathyarchaeota archaeon]